MANVDSQDIWSFLQAMNVPVNSLHSQAHVSIGCEPCTGPVLPWQPEREGRWWWEDAKAKECGLHNKNIKLEVAQLSVHINGVTSLTNGNAGVAGIFNSQNLVSLSRAGIENLARLETRSEPWLEVLYAPWGRFCQVIVAFDQ